MDIEVLNLKPVKDFEEYSVSECGKVVSFKNKEPRVMSTFYGSSGYETLKLSVNNKTTHKMIHRLVGEAFISNPDNKPVIHHKDDNQKNNHYTNLEWTTQRENIAHSYKLLPPTRNFKNVNYII